MFKILQSCKKQDACFNKIGSLIYFRIANILIHQLIETKKLLIAAFGCC